MEAFLKNILYLRIKLMTTVTVAGQPSFRQRKLQVYVDDCNTVRGKKTRFCTIKCTILENWIHIIYMPRISYTFKPGHWLVQSYRCQFLPFFKTQGEIDK